VSNAGGAIKLQGVLELHVLDSEMHENVAIGKDANGGAIVSASAESVELVNTRILHNRVIATLGVGSGAGLSVFGGDLRLDGCLTQGNVAESLRSGSYAKGGGVFVSAGKVLIERSSFRGNSMGGLGVAQPDAAKVGGGHIFAEGGHVVLDGCTIVDGGDAREGPPLENAAHWWTFAAERLVLRNSSFRSATSGQGLLLLQGPPGTGRTYTGVERINGLRAPLQQKLHAYLYHKTRLIILRPPFQI
jgi:hypothetical protein